MYLERPRTYAGPIGMYEGVGPCQGRSAVLLGARARVGKRRPWMVGWVAVRGGSSHQGSRGCEGREAGQARLPRHVFALVVRMMGSLATARLGSISSSTACGSCRSSSSQPGRVRASRGVGGLRETSDLAVA